MEYFLSAAVSQEDRDTEKEENRVFPEKKTNSEYPKEEQPSHESEEKTSGCGGRHLHINVCICGIHIIFLLFNKTVNNNNFKLDFCKFQKITNKIRLPYFLNQCVLIECIFKVWWGTSYWNPQKTFL